MSPPESPAPAASVAVVRPPEGLARGVYPAPAWAVALGCAVLVAAALGYAFVRAKKPRPPTAP